MNANKPQKLLKESSMKKIRLGLLFLLLPSLWLQAKPLHLDDEYAVFGGQPVNLKQVVGQRPVYIKFWATWCLDCRRELPSLQKTYEQFRDKIAIYAVNLNINETDEFILRLQQKNKLTIPIVMDNQGSIAGNFQFHGTPFHVLINAQGEVVYSTYKDDEALQQQLQQLADQTGLKIKREPAATADIHIAPLPKGVSLVYLSTTWCDWYMQDIHPEMAANCLSATETINTIYKQKPDVALQAYVTHLWTEPKDLQEYINKFSIAYPVSIDSDNTIARHYQSTQYPTLLVFRDGKEIKRVEQFAEGTSIQQQIIHLLNEQ
jgi:thiol-disulfide isomerase/thioredoxin